MSDMCVEQPSDTDGGTTGSTTGATTESSTDGETTDESTSSDSGSSSGGSSGTTDDGTTTVGATSEGSGEDDSTGDACLGGVLDTLPIHEDGWVDGDCNVFEIQGPWYCYDDGATPTSCVEGEPPYDNGAMCMTGDALGPVPGTWGAGIGLGLSETDRPPSKLAYDAAARDIVGFQVTIAGFTGGNALRFGFTSSAAPTLPAPFVTVQGAGTHDILLAEAVVPAEWDVENAGETVDPSAIYDVQLQLAGDGMVAPFDFCITNLTPITNP